jgi:hypothetical protein
MARKVHQAIPAGKDQKSQGQTFQKPTGWRKWAWIITAIASGVYIFIPEATDMFPIVGWLDEGLAALILSTALGKLGIRIPILDAMLRRGGGKKGAESASKDIQG